MTITNTTNQAWALQLFEGWWAWLPEDIRDIHRHHFAKQMGIQPTDEGVREYVQARHEARIAANVEAGCLISPSPVLFVDGAVDDDELGHPIIDKHAPEEEKSFFNELMADALDEEIPFDFMPHFKAYEKEFGSVFPFNRYQKSTLSVIYQRLLDSLTE